jgi:hypothetical protein
VVRFDGQRLQGLKKRNDAQNARSKNVIPKIVRSFFSITPREIAHLSACVWHITRAVCDCGHDPRLQS